MSVTFFVVASAVVLIWLLIEVKRMRHKLFAFFIIGLILFSYISFSMVMKKEDVKLDSVDGVLNAGKLYLSWLGTVFTNVKSLAGHAVKQDWTKKDEKIIETIEDEDQVWNKLKSVAN